MKNIFLAGAYGEGDPLPGLMAEIRQIDRCLRHLREQERYEVLRHPAINLNDLCDDFRRLKNSIEIFHYAGHANQHELRLEGGGRGRGVAELFGITQGKTLRFVFLNGCATLGLVDSLHEAGVAAVLATNGRIQDRLAGQFAEHFYETWAVEGATLKEAFDLAVSHLHSKPGGEHREIEVETRGFGRIAAEADAPSPWRLWLSPQLNEAERQQVLGLQINPPVQLPPQVLAKVETTVSQSLRNVARAFYKSDARARKKVDEEECSELTALITYLPWPVGSHLRRLFAVDVQKTVLRSGRPRLRELAAGYTELTRFICYTALSALWDDSLNHRQQVRLPESELFPDAPDSPPPAYLFHLKHIHRLLLDIPGDPHGLEAEIGDFLAQVDGSLQPCCHFMERLNDALTQTANYDRFIAAYGGAGGEDEVCRIAEAFFGAMIKAAFFLTRYRLYSVRAISVDKVRYIDLDEPFVHKTIELHAAFSPPRLVPTGRKTPGDNYSILLTPWRENQQDPFENALNLSPFYLDKHALIGEKRENIPAIYVLKRRKEIPRGSNIPPEKVYGYDYIDADVNHDYLADDDHRMDLDEAGLLQANDELPLKPEDRKRFRDVFRQLEKLDHHFDTTL